VRSGRRERRAASAPWDIKVDDERRAGVGDEVDMTGRFGWD
jgi:hypothetical protein